MAARVAGGRKAILRSLHFSHPIVGEYFRFPAFDALHNFLGDIFRGIRGSQGPVVFLVFGYFFDNCRRQ